MLTLPNSQRKERELLQPLCLDTPYFRQQPTKLSNKKKETKRNCLNFIDTAVTALGLEQKL